MNKRKKSKIGIAVFLVFFAYFAVTLIDQQRLLADKASQYIRMQKMVLEEQKLNEELTTQKDALDSDENIERIAREKLGMVKKGEKIFIDANR